MAICNTVFVKSVNPGGRLFSAIHQTEERKNGEIGKLGAYAQIVDGAESNTQTTIKKFEKIQVADANTSVQIGIVMQPEMMYDNSRMSLQKLNLFKIDAKTPFVFVPLEEGDKFEITADLINQVNGDVNALAVGHVLTLPQNDTKYRYTGNTPNQEPAVGHRFFKVVKVRNLHARRPYIGKELKVLNDEKMYTIEYCLKRA